MKKIGVLFVLVCNLLMVSLVSAQDGGELSLEEQKKIIEASYDGGIVHEAIVMDEETLIFYDGKEWQELSALWGFNDEPIPWGEVYSFDNPEDIAKLKEISAQESEKVRMIDVHKEMFPETTFLQFYPQNDTWTFQGDINKDNYATFELNGFFILKENNKIKVIETKTNPSTTLVLYQEKSTGQFSTMQISEGNGLSPSLIGISPEWAFSPDSNGNVLIYNEYTQEYRDNLLGGEDLNSNNINEFISEIENGKIPFFSFAFQTGTIADKE